MVNWSIFIVTTGVLHGSDGPWLDWSWPNKRWASQGLHNFSLPPAHSWHVLRLISLVIW